MPSSRGRHAHKHPHTQSTKQTKKARTPSKNRATIVAIVFFTLLGLGIGFFIDDSSTLTILTSTIAGAVLGYLFGHQIDKSFQTPK